MLNMNLLYSSHNHERNNETGTRQESFGALSKNEIFNMKTNRVQRIPATEYREDIKESTVSRKWHQKNKS